LMGDIDGLHWGYYLDDPATGPSCVASYYNNDSFELMTDGNTLFEALRLDLEQRYRDCLDYRQDNAEHAADYNASLAPPADLRRAVQRYETADRPEVGEEYVEKYVAERRRAKRVVAQTHEGMGIVAPRELYRPLSLKDKQLWKALWSD